MRNKVLIVSVLFVAVLIIALSAYGYWETLPYASYKIGEPIEGFPFESTSMTVNGFSVAPDVTFPTEAIDIFVNVTVQRLGSNPGQSEFAESLIKHLFLRYQTSAYHGEVSAWNESYGMGIVTPDNEINSLTVNQSVNGSIRFVLGNSNYSSFQLVCRVESQLKPLFTVDLSSP